jgi:hypothetical protein
MSTLLVKWLGTNLMTRIKSAHSAKVSCTTWANMLLKNWCLCQPPIPSILLRSYSTPSLICQLIIRKYQYGLSLYRQEVIRDKNVIDVGKRKRIKLEPDPKVSPRIIYMNQ